MKTMTYRGIGKNRKLSFCEISIPLPHEGQVQVKVHATSVNPIDWKLRQGVLGWLGSFGVFPPIPCFDFVGTVSANGAGTSAIALGQKVFGMLSLRNLGAAAEYLVTDASTLAFTGDHLDDFTLAGLPLAGMTALQALRDHGKIKAGDRVLVIGGSGGVGHLAIQIAKSFKAEVTATTGPNNLDLATSLGADDVIDYTGTLKPEGLFDVIFDTVVNEPFSSWKPLLAKWGHYVSVLPTPKLFLLSKVKWLAKEYSVRIVGVKPCQADLNYLRESAEKGTLQVLTDHIYDLDCLEEAMARSMSGRTKGKNIIKVFTP